MLEQGKQKLIILSGISGSGKTTIATDLCNKFEKHIRVNRDDLRKQLIGKLDQSYYKRRDLSSLEKQVTWLLFAQIRHLLQHGYTVVVDNTHLKESYINELLSEFQHLVEIELKFIQTPLGTCIKRVLKRETNKKWWKFWEKVDFDTSYIIKQHNDFEKLLVKYWGKDLVFPQTNTKIYNNTSLVSTVICDLDGTLCLYGDRNPYDRDFENDKLNYPVYIVLRQWLNNKDKVIIFFSGRNEKFRKQTELFLAKYFDTSEYLLYMRPEKDQRKDTIIKEEMFINYVLNKFYVDFVIDDRMCVIRNVWHKLGLFCFCVNQGFVEF